MRHAGSREDHSKSFQIVSGSFLQRSIYKKFSLDSIAHFHKQKLPGVNGDVLINWGLKFLTSHHRQCSSHA
jgi:hypothetical protein